MTALFESTIDNVSELEVKCYSDPVKMEHIMEIWTKTGDEEYVYKFTGPGVRMANIPMVDECLKLSKEIEKLKQENLSLMEQNQRLSEGNKDLRAGFDKVTKRAEELRKMINETKGLHYPITRERVLEQAKECVCGQREQDYGTPESNFQLIADLWNGYLGFMDHPQDQIRATDVAMMMALMKIARIRNGGGSGDSFVDLAGYAACGGEIWHGERHSNA